MGVGAPGGENDLALAPSAIEITFQRELRDLYIYRATARPHELLRKAFQCLEGPGEAHLLEDPGLAISEAKSKAGPKGAPHLKGYSGPAPHRI